MKMQMLNKLAGCSAVIAQYIVTVKIHRGSYSGGDFAETQSDPAEKLWGTIVQFLKMLLWNYQRVAIAYGANIQKS
jgi:hypothetical protein